VWLEDSSGKVLSKAPTGERLEIHALVEMTRGGTEAACACELHDDEEGNVVRTLEPQPLGDPDRRVRPGDRLHARFPLGADLPPGPYLAACHVLRGGATGQTVAMSEPSLLDFSVARSECLRSAPAAPGETAERRARAAAARL